MKAKTLPQRDDKAPAGGEQPKKSSGKSNATTGKSGGAIERTVPAAGAARKGESSVQPVVPNVSKVPAGPVPVPIPYPNTGKSTPAKGVKGATRKELPQPLKKTPSFKPESNLPEGVLVPKTRVPITTPAAPKISIPNSKAPKATIPVTVAPKAKIPIVKPEVMNHMTGAPGAKIPPTVAPQKKP